MITDLTDILSVNVKGMKRSAIRELLKYLGKPGLISFSEAFRLRRLFRLRAERNHRRGDG